MKTSHSPQRHSLTANKRKLVELRQKLTWTQKEAGLHAGYSDRLIRKIEREEPVRPQTLNDVVQCYHEALGIASWSVDQFIKASNESNPEVVLTEAQCENCRTIRRYFELVYCQRQPEKIDDFCCQNIRFTGEGSSRSGIEAIHQRANVLLTAFDPIYFDFERIHSIDKIVFSFWSVKMQHSGNFFEIPATGRWVEIRGNNVAQFADGLVVQSEDHFDVESVIRQINGEEPRII